MELVVKTIGLFLLGLISILALATLMAIPTMYLWDWIMPKLFCLPEITLFEAWGIMVLSGILFKGNTTVKTK